MFILYQRLIHTAVIAHAITHSNVSLLVNAPTCHTLIMLNIGVLLTVHLSN